MEDKNACIPFVCNYRNYKKSILCTPSTIENACGLHHKLGSDKRNLHKHVPSNKREWRRESIGKAQFSFDWRNAADTTLK